MPDAKRPASQVHASLGSGRLQASHRLAVEHRPADVVSQLLIIQDKVADRFRQLLALPTALAPAGTLTLASEGGRTRRIVIKRGSRPLGRITVAPVLLHLPNVVLSGAPRSRLNTPEW